MTAHIDRLTAALEGRYAIERELGASGLTIAYPAKDLKHLHILKRDRSPTLCGWAELICREVLLASALFALGARIPTRALAGQQPTEPAGIPIASQFGPLELTAPNAYRTGAGTPGPLYWQQRVDYSIRASLDTSTHTVRGAETIRYTNNSPDTLRYVWIQLDQNLGSTSNPFSIISQRYQSEPGFVGGYEIERVGALRSGEPATFIPLDYRIHGTLMQVSLDRPLPPGWADSLDIAWHFQVPLYWRTGRELFPEGWLYQVGQWFPRMAVYDDVKGWNTEQYTGNGEFYLEYGDIDYAITAPAGYTVTGSGVLTNANEVLATEQRRRLAFAAQSDTTVAVIAPDEVGEPSLVPVGLGTERTWRFRAQNVRDVAWAAAPNFIWDATGWDGILIQALYPPTALPMWSRAAEESRFVIREFSDRLGRYPYPIATNVNGPARGMEYPMIVFNHGRGDLVDSTGVVRVEEMRRLFMGALHEFGHQWFPMQVGTNERLYGWQDEGIVNLVSIPVWHDRFPNDTTMEAGLSAADVVDWIPLWAGRNEPIMAPIERDPSGLFFQHYTKSAVGLHFLRHEVVDSLAFDAAIREYVRRWTFKHATPADFFRTMNDALGSDLSWFWRSWFFRTDQLDLAVDSVSQRDSVDTTISHTYLAVHAEMVAPVEMLVLGADSSEQTIKLPVEIWQQGMRYVHRLTTPHEARPVHIEIDPRRVYPDVNRSNNSWSTVPQGLL